METLHQRAQGVIAAFAARGWRLAIAESCTGGLISATLTGQPGSSALLDASIVAYSNEAKEALLHVPKDMMIAHGAVSAPVAAQMAQAARLAAGSSVGLGVTGVAGPGGGTPDKPVGRIYLALSRATGETEAQTFDFAGDRAAVQAQTVAEALGLLLDAAGADGSP